MRYFLYLDKDSAILISEEEIVETHTKKYRKKRIKAGWSVWEPLEDNKIIEDWVLSEDAIEIEYSGEGPIAPRWAPGPSICTFYNTCKFGHECPKAALPWRVDKDSIVIDKDEPICYVHKL